MSSNDIDQLLNRVKETIHEALVEYQEASMIRENDLSEYSLAQQKINEIQVEVDTLIQDLSPTNRPEALLEAQQDLYEIQELLNQ